MFFGIQYIYSSVEEKAKSKQHLVAYVIGCAILLGAYGIWKVVVDISQSTETETVEASPSDQPTENPTEEPGQGNSGGKAENGGNSGTGSSGGSSSSKGTSSNKTTNTKLSNLKLNKKTAIIYPNSVQLLYVIGAGNDVTKTWKSFDKSVATVSKEGLVRGIKEGTAKITVKVKNAKGKTKTLRCKVTVKKPTTSSDTTTTGKNVSTFLSVVQKYSTQIEQDYKSGNYWEYSNGASGERKQYFTSFTSAKNGEKTINCARVGFWPLYEMGIIKTSANLYADQTTGALKNATSEIRAQLNKYAKIINVNSSPNALASSGNLKRGDIVGYVHHVNVYAGNGKWYDAGRASGITGGQANIFKWTVRNGNSIWRVRTIGPGSSYFSGTRATFIIRLNDQT